MDNKGRTYLFTALVLTSILLLVAAIGLTSAAKPYCGDGKCQGQENEQNCPEDCKLPDPEPESYANVCLIFWDNVNTKVNKINGNGPSKCTIGSGGNCPLPSGDSLDYDPGDCDFIDETAFTDWMQNTCDAAAYGGTGTVVIIDQTGCGQGNRGCGNNGQGKGADCKDTSLQALVSPMHDVGGTLEDFYVTGSDCDSACGDTQDCTTHTKCNQKTTGDCGNFNSCDDDNC